MAHRHPDAEHLKAYIDNSEPYHADAKGPKDECKKLYRALLCGGGAALLRQHARAHGPAGALVDAFHEECRRLMAADVAANPHLLERAKGRSFPEAAA
eukprot:15445322-Alexandrium_andersonii.AAC.1